MAVFYYLKTMVNLRALVLHKGRIDLAWFPRLFPSILDFDSFEL